MLINELYHYIAVITSVQGLRHSSVCYRGNRHTDWNKCALGTQQQSIGEKENVKKVTKIIMIWHTCCLINGDFIFTKNTRPRCNAVKTMSCCLVAKFVLAVVTARYVTLVSIVGRNTVYNGLGWKSRAIFYFKHLLMT